MSSTRLTKYEYARLIGARATQLSLGATPTVDLESIPFPHRINPLKIAEEEYRKGTIPIKVIRDFPDGTRKVVTFSHA